MTTRHDYIIEALQADKEGRLETPGFKFKTFESLVAHLLSGGEYLINPGPESMEGGTPIISDDLLKLGSEPVESKYDQYGMYAETIETFEKMAKSKELADYYRDSDFLELTEMEKQILLNPYIGAVWE